MAAESGPRVSRGRWAMIVVGLVVVIAAAASTKRISISEADQADPNAFNPAAYAADRYESAVVPFIEDQAVDLVELLDALDGGADESEFGNTPGTASSFSFPVTLTGTVGERRGDAVEVLVEGVDPEVTVQVQIGPALNGTALRDVSGTISFNEFTNQLEYQQIGTELNNIVRAEVLAAVDSDSLAGQAIEVTGAFTRVNPQLVSVVPISVVVVP